MWKLIEKLQRRETENMRGWRWYKVSKDEKNSGTLRLRFCGTHDKRNENGTLLKFEAIDIADTIANKCLEKIKHLKVYRDLTKEFDKEKVRVFF